MANKARNYTDMTLKRLFGLSGNECAFSTCTKRLVNQDNALDSNICHIEAASEGGERYNEDMSDKERADYSNLILLCPQHHSETNNVEIYTVEALIMMKRNHESDILNSKLKTNPSMLKNAINAISNIALTEINEAEILNVFDPKLKISHNSIKRNVALIQEYKVYHKKINTLYEELEKQGSIKKERLLNIIRNTYIEVKGKYILDSNNELEIIKLNSDNIIDDIFETLYLKMEDSQFWEEDIILGIRLIMVDAFMRCKILEEPK
jgi:hypothetical protein